MTGDTIWRTITDIITVRTVTTTPHTASEVHGTGAGIITHGTAVHGIGTHGPTPLGDITAGTIRSMWEAGMTLGIMEVFTSVGGDPIIADGTGAGIHTGTDITTDTTRDITMTMWRNGTEKDIRQDLTGHMQAGAASEPV